MVVVMMMMMVVGGDDDAPITRRRSKKFKGKLTPKLVIPMTKRHHNKNARAIRVMKVTRVYLDY